MSWRILRTTTNLDDDPDWVNDGTDPPSNIRVDVAELRRSAQGLFAVRVAWLEGQLVTPGYGAVTLQVVTVDQVPASQSVGAISIPLTSIGPSAALSQPPVTTARTPLVLEAPQTGAGQLTIRVSGMAGPDAATALRIYVETVDPQP